jgi:hypothetical protein
MENTKRLNKTIARKFFHVGEPFIFIGLWTNYKQKVSIYDLPVRTIATGQGGFVYGNGIQNENQDNRTPGRSLSVPVMRV